jgi:hypothetical protein
MAPIDFKVTRLKGKVKGALNVKTVSPDYLQKYSAQSFYISHVDWS